MKRLIVLIVAAILVAAFAGCGNVYLRGEALTAAETSALHANEAQRRAAEQSVEPPWVRAYLLENARQWREFVRSAHKDKTWGPVLEGD